MGADTCRGARYQCFATGGGNATGKNGWRGQVPPGNGPVFIPETTKVEKKGQTISWRDALIVSSARMIGCDFLLTDDLQENRESWRIKIINPFYTPPESIGL